MPKINPELQATWKSRLQNYHTSGLSVKKWCEENQIGIHQFKYWSNKLRTAQELNHKTLQWIAVQPDPPESLSSEEPPMIIKIKQVAIEVQSGFDPHLLRQIVKTLADL